MHSHLSSATHPQRDDLRGDVVVIGSGATGQSIARRLAHSGVDVLVVEAGPAAEVHRKSQALLQAAMPAVHGQYPDFGGHLLMNLGGSIGKPQMPLSSDGSRPAEGIRLAKLTEADFGGWPIERADLDPYYDIVSDWFGINWDTEPTPVFADPRLHAAPFHITSRRSFSHPTPEHLAEIRVLLDAPVVRLETDATGRVRAALVETQNGLQHRVEGTTFVLAMNTMPATQLLLHSKAANSSGLLGHHLMDHPLITLGYIEPETDLPRDLLTSLTPKEIPSGLWWPKLVSNQDNVAAGELVNIAATLVPLEWSVRRNRARHRLLKPVVVGARSGAKHSLERVVAGVKHRDVSFDLAKDIARTAAGVDELLHIKFRPKGPRFNLENGWWADELTAGLPKTFEILAMAEQVGRYENHVALSEERNALGWQKLRANWRYSAADKDATDRAARPIMDALVDAGFGKLTRLPPARHTENYSCHHASGTIRMSADPTSGVVDQNCRTHDHDNLYVCGMSVFPSIGFANPTLTSMALGVRAADHIVAKLPHRATSARAKPEFDRSTPQLPGRDGSNLEPRPHERPPVQS